jgi:hypothetical protein
LKKRKLKQILFSKYIERRRKKKTHKDGYQAYSDDKYKHQPVNSEFADKFIESQIQSKDLKNSVNYINKPPKYVIEKPGGYQTEYQKYKENHKYQMDNREPEVIIHSPVDVRGHPDLKKVFIFLLLQKK